MRLKIIFTFCIVSALAAAASAQTRMAGTEYCGKASKEYSVQIGDRPNHSFSIIQGSCTWTSPVEIAGVHSKDGVYSTLGETRGNRIHYHLYYIDTMVNGDKAFYRGEGTMTMKDGVPQTGHERWTLVGGTGKLKGLKGKGTNTLKSAKADGSSTWYTEGEYELPM